LLSNKLIKRETLDKAFSRYILADGMETAYGYGWRLGYIQKSQSIWHGGLINGFFTMSMYLPTEDVFVTVLSNCDCNSPADVTARLAAFAIDQPYDFKEIPIEASLLDDYTGVFENANGEQRIITISENQLYSQRGRNPKFAMKAYQSDKFFFDNSFLTIEFSRSPDHRVEKLTTYNRDGIEVWNKTNNPVHMPVEIKLSEKILERYVGEYSISPQFSFVVSLVQGKLFVQATGQEAFEISAETETRFFVKDDDVQFDFMIDDAGKVISSKLKQGGREIEAKKVR
jgi:hypothetical protein